MHQKSGLYKIAITGRASTGKNTLSRMLTKALRERHRPNYMSVKYMAFADPIKEMARTMFPQIPRKFLYGSSSFRKEIVKNAFDKMGNPLTVRQILIDIGTAGREYKENIWLDNFDQRLESAHQKVVIVTDVRFRNEFDHLKAKGFYQVRLYRQTEGPVINHASETEQSSITDDEFDYVIHNDKGLKDLRDEVNRIVDLLK